MRLRNPTQPAVLFEDADGKTRALTYGQLQRQANRLANVLVQCGVRAGDRVAIHLPQSFEAAFAHVAVYKVGAIALPLFSLFGPDALRHRLGDSGANVLITCRDNLAVLDAVRDDLGDLRHVLVSDDALGGQDLRDLMARASDAFTTKDTGADDPAMLIYTSGTTGDPKGALHAHRVLIGHMPGVEFPHRYLPQPGDLMWTPADWAWAGGPAGCAAAGAISWPAGAGEAVLEVRAGSCFRSDGAARCAQHVHAGDGAAHAAAAS